MFFVSRDITDDELIDVIRGWVDVLAAEDYDSFAEAVGYEVWGYPPTGNDIENDIKSYRSSLYPRVKHFFVTDWRTAKVAKYKPRTNVIWL